MTLSRADSITELSPLKFSGLGNELSVLDGTPPSPDTVLPFSIDKLASRSPFPPDTEVSYTISAPADSSRMYSPIAFFDDNFDFDQQRLAAIASQAQQHSSDSRGAAEPPPTSSLPPLALQLDARPSPTTAKPPVPPSKKRPRPSRPAAVPRDTATTLSLAAAVADGDDVDVDHNNNDNDDDDAYDGTDSDVVKKRPASKKKKKTSAPSNNGGGSNNSIAPRSRNATSMYRGVSRCSKDGRWQARIRIRKIVVYLGRYPEEEDAARKYDEAAREHHGPRAVLNFLTEEDIRIGCKSVFGGGGGGALSENDE